MPIAITVNNEYCGAPGPKKEYPTIEELKKKYNSYAIDAEKMPLANSSAPIMFPKSSVKQIASMFNNKILQKSIDGNNNMSMVSKPAEAKTQINIPIPAIRHSGRSKFAHEQASIPSPGTKSKLKVQKTSNTFFASEDTFTKLSVKHKVHLYNEFVNQMFKNNLKLVKPDEQMEPAGVEKTAFAGEVINEKQASVKHLLAKLEANCPLPRQKVSALAQHNICTTKNYTQKLRIKAKLSRKVKQFEDILLQSSKNTIHRETRTKSLKPCINYLKATVEVQNAKPMCYSLPLETFDKTKQITRTRAELLFQSQQMKNLFLTWLNEKDDKENEKTKSTSNSSKDLLSENTATTGLEDPDNNTSRGNEKLPTKCKPLEPTPRQRKKKPAPPIPAPVSNANNSQVSANDSEKFQSNDNSESGISLVQKITSDESQADKPAVKREKEFEFVKPLKPVQKRKHRCTSTWQNNESSQKTIKTDEITNQINEQRLPNHRNSEELHNDLLHEVKSAYTLSSHSQSSSQEQENKINYLQHKISQTWSSTIKKSTEQQPNSSQKVASNAVNSFVDQDFETGSNDTNSPVRVVKCCTFKKQPGQQLHIFLPKPTTDNKETENTSCFQAGMKELQPIPFTNNLLQQHRYSSIPMLLKNRRKSIYDNEFGRNSLAMQVIRENQPLETVDMPTENISQFWIKCDHFSLSFDVCYIKAERLRLLYNIFSQKSWDNKDLCFGIDNFAFSINQTNEKQKFSKRLHLTDESSQFWFSTADLIIPFAGKRILPAKIQNIFQLLKTCIEDNDDIQFGVDSVEFSKVHELWNQTPKFSMDSNYSVLVGLQSGTSNGLEGRSKYAWPYSSKSDRVSDLEQFNNGVYNFEDISSIRSSLSPFSDKQFEFSASSPTEPHTKQSRRSSEIFNFVYRKESLDHLFDKQYKRESSQPIDAPAPVTFKLNKNS